MLLHFLLFPRSGHHLYLNPRGCSNPRFNSFCMSYIIQHTPPHGGPQIFSFWIKTMATLVWIYFTWSIQFKQRNSKTITFLYIVENMHPGYAFRARKCSMHKTHGRHEKLRNVIPRSFAYREKRKERRPRGSSDVRNTPRHFTSGTSHLVLGEGRRASCLGEDFKARLSVLRAFGIRDTRGSRSFSSRLACTNNLIHPRNAVKAVYMLF